MIELRSSTGSTVSSRRRSSLLFSAVKVVGAFAVLMSWSPTSCCVERRVVRVHQDRIGPNRVGAVRLAAARGGRREGVLQGGLHAGARAQGLFLARAGHRADPGDAEPRGDSVRLEHRQAADGARGPERRHSLHVRHRVAGRLQHRAGGLRGELQVSVPRRHPLHARR